MTKIFLFDMLALYIDPGSGAVLWQIVTATCLGGVLTFRNRLKSLFRKK